MAAKKHKIQRYDVKCRSCGGQWRARSPHPVSCRHCRGRSPTQPTRIERTDEWLAQRLRAAAAPGDVYSDAEQAGISRRAIRSACARLGVLVETVRPGREYLWRLPD